MAALLFTTQSAFDSNIWDMVRQYVAGLSPELSEQWGKFTDWLSQPRKPASCDYQSPLGLNGRKMSWQLSLLGGSHLPSFAQ